ncbi:MAG TPA: GNAT family N-acetyltransferase [Candidatus Saccharimonadia bacterium]|nr:GNAT family N-acetyltransferase [Candidatus Saccharimonadia bacterium]
MPVTVRKALPDDVPALLEIERASFSSDRLSPRQLRDHANGRSNSRFLVAVRGRRIVGNALVFLRRGARLARLYSIVVSATERGAGVGDRLLHRAEREARSAGADRIGLEVRTGNAAAIALYEREGYRRIGRVQGYYEDGADAYRYTKPLRPGAGGSAAATLGRGPARKRAS